MKIGIAAAALALSLHLALMEHEGDDMFELHNHHPLLPEDLIKPSSDFLHINTNEQPRERGSPINQLTAEVLRESTAPHVKGMCMGFQSIDNIDPACLPQAG